MRLTWVLLGSMAGGCVVSQATKTDDPTTDTGDVPTRDTGEAVVDADQDGFTSDVDCDDSDPLINPDAVEACDGIDNDCSRAIDDGKGEASIGSGKDAVLYATVDEAIAEGLKTAGTTVDVCAGTYLVTPLVLGEGAQLTLHGAGMREQTTIQAESNLTLARLTENAELTIEGLTVTGSLQRAFVLEDASALTLLDSMISANPGGGVHIAEGSEGVDLIVQGTNFENNVIAGRGGAILAEGRAFDVVIEPSKMHASQLRANGADRGGAIALVNRPFAQQAARRVQLRGDTGFAGNVARSGGAIYTEVGTFELEQVNFDGNVATEQGGAIDLAISSVVSLEDSTLVNNEAPIGGAVSMDVFGLSVLTGTSNVAIVDNIASEVGGGISGAGAVRGILIARNSAPVGGGVHVPAGSFLTLEEVTLDDNEAIQGGGMFLDADTDVDLVDVAFTLDRAVPEFFEPQTTTTLPPVPLPLPDVVEPEFAGLGGAAFLVDGSELTATTCNFGIDESDIGGVDNDNRPGDVFIRALGSDSNHEQLGRDVSVVCDDGGCLLVSAP